MIISGSASPRGIGKATAELFAAHGARTVILDLDREACEAVAKEVGGGSIGIGCDIRDKGACNEAVERVVGAFGRVDVLVNNAGVGSGTPILDITPEEVTAHPPASGFEVFVTVGERSGMWLSVMVCGWGSRMVTGG